DGSVKQELLDGYLPILVNRWQSAGITYEQTCVATFLEGEPGAIRGDETVVLLARLVIHNTTPERVSDEVVFSIEPGEDLLWRDDGHIFAAGPKSCHRFYLYPAPNTGQRTPMRSVQWTTQLDPGASASILLAVPFITLESQ